MNVTKENPRVTTMQYARTTLEVMTVNATVDILEMENHVQVRRVL